MTRQSSDVQPMQPAYARNGRTLEDHLPLRRLPLWSGLGLVAPLEARVHGTIPRAITGISIDTRSLQPGELFVALTGERDGHGFVGDAFAKGAAAAIVDEAHADALGGLGPLYVVHDVLAALERLGRAARARNRGRIVAVTGSVGKTSTKEALRLILGDQGETHAASASFNNHIGVPLTLARMHAASGFGVFEIGMNHAGEITPLTAMVRPHVAMITNVGAVHIESFASVEAIADAKAEIFSGLEPGGTAIIPRDSEHYERLRDHARASPAGRLMSFGEHADADARLLDVTLARDHSDATVGVDGEVLTYRIGAPGKHLVLNSLAVLGAVAAMGADLQRAMTSYGRLLQPKGRGARLRLHGPGGVFTVIDESYNANPLSMGAALALLRQTTPETLGRRIVVLGDMLELGPDAPALHAELAQAVIDSGADMVFAAGPLMKNLYDAVPGRIRADWTPTAADLEPSVVQSVYAGDVVMVKGSNGSRMAAIVDALQKRFTPNVVNEV